MDEWRVLYVRKSGNKKIGKIPTSIIESRSCPDSCSFRDNKSCYAKQGPMSWQWKKLDEGRIGITWEEYCGNIQALPEKTFWRHGSAGDSPGDRVELSWRHLKMLVMANVGKQGYGYCHYDANIAWNAAVIASCNRMGFALNISADSLGEADRAVELGVGPVCVVVSMDYPAGGGRTPGGRRVVTCPAQTRDDMTCDDCRLCANIDRKVIIGFRAHGIKARQAEAVVQG